MLTSLLAPAFVRALGAPSYVAHLAPWTETKMVCMIPKKEKRLHAILNTCEVSKYPSLILFNLISWK